MIDELKIASAISDLAGAVRSIPTLFDVHVHQAHSISIDWSVWALIGFGAGLILGAFLKGRTT